MNIHDILKQYQEGEVIRSLMPLLEKGKSRIQLTQVWGSGISFIATALHLITEKSLLMVVESEEEAEFLLSDLQSLYAAGSFHLMCDSYKRPYDFTMADDDKIRQRTEVLSGISEQNKPVVIITYPAALSEKVINIKTLLSNTLTLKKGEVLDLEFLIDTLYDQGYEKHDFTYTAGEFSIRGGIIDIYSFGSAHPFRLVMDEDVIEHIKSFDAQTQLSVKEEKKIKIMPRINQSVKEEDRISVFEYLPDEMVVCCHNVPTLLEAHTESLGERDLPHMMTGRQIESAFLSKNIIEWGTLFHFKATHQIDARQKPTPDFGKNINMAFNHMREQELSGFTCLIFSEQARQFERLLSIIRDKQKLIQPMPVYHSLRSGLIDQSLQLAFYTEHQLFHRFYRFKNRRKNSMGTGALTIKELRELRPGDYVTHIDHGVGKFAGLHASDVKGKMQEMVRIIYKDNDMLMVSIQSLHKISKFSGQDGKVPKVHKLGSGSWEKQKATTKKKVKDIARELIRLYAIRKSKPGFAFMPDNYLQHELEASFFYEDTPDQAKASEAVKKDMEKEVPMDRLVCGDVGFGKTEVAIRAAFKAVCNSKQVAILVPTTILAYQHYRTFRERMEGMPVNVDFINRFKSKKEQKETLEHVANGKIDILIGTHRILSKDVIFKDLGLLVIDEEQKFGVSAKEKLRELRANIDTLTLTATPIPRTLHFSLMGARDLSVISTPPQNRQPIQTELHLFSKDLIVDAVLREVNRGGQVFFVHNRIKDIYGLQEMLERELPDVRIAVAHGQMDGNELENIMIQFIEHEFDVLVSTSIIETGLDITNGNTMIINNAHQFGLSDLHQLRGRVGRSNTKAYCLLLTPTITQLNEDARKRLKTIEEFNELGSGFQIAMRDMDIRGAGNLLGGEQSGFITEMGMDVYHKILDEAVSELKEDEFKELFEDVEIDIKSKDCQVDTEEEMMIPTYYINQTAERLSIYQQLASLEGIEEVQEFVLMLKDRFGELPQSVVNLIQAVKIKWKGRALGFEKISLSGHKLKISPPENPKSSYYQHPVFEKLMQYISSNPQRFTVKDSPKGLLIIVEHIQNIQQAEMFLEQMEKQVL
jgi:transcription-repair coupling factor (superfamily II helicase)